MTPFPTAYTRPIYSNYINSLSHPSTSIAPPPSTLTYTLHSTNCALLLTGQGTLISSLQLWSRVTRFAYLMGLVQVVLLWKMIQQIESSLGGGGNGRLSWLMIGLQVGLDGYFFIICFTVGLVTNNRASLPLLVPAFFSMLSSLLFGMRWAATIRAAIPPAPSAPPAPTLAEITVRAAERRAAIENPILLQLTSFSGRVGDDLSYGMFMIVQVRRELTENYLVALGIGIAIFSLSIIFKYGWLALSIIVLHSYWRT